MTLIFSILIVASIAAMAWAFLASTKLDAAALELEHRVRSRLDNIHAPTTETDKGAPK